MKNNVKNSNFNIGLDIGSTTIKCVILQNENIIFKFYERHQSKIAEK